MTDNLRRICLMASAVAVMGLASPAPAQLWPSLSGKPRPHMATKKPNLIVLCLPPGGTKPVPCATAAAGSTLHLDTDLRGSVPLRATLISVSGAGRASVQARPVPGRDGSYLITVPRHLCAKDKLGNFEIQIATSDMNQAEGKVHDADSIGYFQMQC